MQKNIAKNHNNIQAHLVKIALITLGTSSLLNANSCSAGACGVTVPHISTDIDNNTEFKPFNASTQNVSTQAKIKEGFKSWAVVDNAGDNAIGENRFMAGVDANSLFKRGDKLTLFGLLTSESLNSGKVSYAYPFSQNDFSTEFSYSHTNYILDVAFPGASGIGTINTLEWKMLYRLINSQQTNFNFGLSINNNNINDEITNEEVVTNINKSSYEASAYIDLKAKNYPLFTLNTSHTFYLGITTGYLSFDNKDDEKLDQLTFKTKGSYSKVNFEYSNSMALSPRTSLESKFRSQYALNNKNLDASESFSIGGINGVKTYEESSAYSSNGIFASIEAKYKLPDFYSINNSIGTFYDYGKIWESDSIFSSQEDISIQDVGIGLYTSYKAFFSKAQVAFEVGNSDISTKDDKNYRVILQAGFVF